MTQIWKLVLPIPLGELEYTGKQTVTVNICSYSVVAMVYDWELERVTIHGLDPQGFYITYSKL